MDCAGETRRSGHGAGGLPVPHRVCAIEPLEDRRLLSFSITFAGTPTLTQGADVNVTSLSGNQTESFIAANPASPANLITYSNTGTGNLAWYSTNGGTTWTQTTIPAPANTIASSDRDPNIAFDRNGVAWLAYLADDTVNGSINHIVLSKSVNGGQTWTSIDLASGVVYHPFVAIGANPTNVAIDNIYVSYRQDVVESTFADSQIHLRASTDGGMTFPTDVIINDDSINDIDDASYAALAVGADGRLYAAWEDSSGQPTSSDIKLDTSADGGATWGTDVSILVGTAAATTGVTYAVGTSGHYTIPAAPDQGILTVPSLAVARSGPYAGRVYVAYTFIAPGSGALSTYAQTDVRLVYTDDLLSGAPTWTAKKVNDDTNATKSQFHPWVSLDQSSGFVYFTWFDSRNSTSNNTAQRYSAFSTDGGATIRANVRVSDGTANQSSGNANRDRSNYGDFNVHSSIGGVINAAWTDNANQTSNDVYFDRAALDGQQVAATGTTGDDSYYLRLDSSGTFVQIFENAPASGTPAFTVLKSSVSSLALNLDTGNNTVTVDYANGNPLPAGGLSVSGAGNHTMIISGTAAAATCLLNGGMTTLTTSNPANTAALTVSVAAGAGVKFASSARLASLVVASGATAEMVAGAAAGEKVLFTQSLNLTGAAKLDLRNNGLVVDYTGATVLPAIDALIASGYNAAATHWTGPGIMSSTSAANAATAVGSTESSVALGATGGTFLGQAVDGSCVLVRYTLAGDANLNGTVDFFDLTALAANYGSTAGAWSTADFNYDGQVNFFDLTTLSANYGAPLPAGVPLPSMDVPIAASAVVTSTIEPVTSSAGSTSVTSTIPPANDSQRIQRYGRPSVVPRRWPTRRTTFATGHAIPYWIGPLADVSAAFGGSRVRSFLRSDNR